MNYVEALALAHEILEPASYCEIGCRLGYSLAISRAPSIAIDPDFEIRQQIVAPVRLFKMTSDDFFAQPGVAAIVDRPFDLSFIDGMHLVENALRDFINLEKFSSPGSAIAIDDLLPQQMQYASRVRETQVWTGDVYRLMLVLQHYRPDLDIRVYDIEMKGFGLITKLDPTSRVLAESSPTIEAELAAGKWAAASADEIRNLLKPLPVDQLEPDLEALKQARPRRIDREASGDRGLYLDLLKRSILNEIYLDDELRIHYLKACLAGFDTYDAGVLHDIRRARQADYGKLSQTRQVGQFLDRKIENAGFSHSMMGRARMDSLHACLDLLRTEDIQGDLIECGVWRGGGCIFMAGYMAAHGMSGRRLFVADSFEGLPAPRLAEDAGLDLSKGKYPELAVSLPVVRDNFAVYGLDLPNIFYLEGWFKDTLPAAPADRIALLRLDGDLYESTMDILNALYDRVVEGGIIIVDDYNAVAACKQAIDDFFSRRGIPLPNLQSIDWTGVWFRKPSAPTAAVGRSFSTFFAPHQLDAYQRGVMNYAYGGLPCHKSPIDTAIYLALLDEVKPQTIIEIGTKFGGSAKMLRDFARLSRHDATVISIDIKVPALELEGVRFLEGDVLDLASVFAREGLYDLPRPWLVIEDSAHTAPCCEAALKFFAAHLEDGEWLVMEDGVLNELGLADGYGGGPNKAIADFFAMHPGVFTVGDKYCDMFGKNATYNPNGYLRRTGASFS